MFERFFSKDFQIHFSALLVAVTCMVSAPDLALAQPAESGVFPECDSAASAAFSGCISSTPGMLAPDACLAVADAAYNACLLLVAIAIPPENSAGGGGSPDLDDTPVDAEPADPSSDASPLTECDAVASTAFSGCIASNPLAVLVADACAAVAEAAYSSCLLLTSIANPEPIAIGGGGLDDWTPAEPVPTYPNDNRGSTPDPITECADCGMPAQPTPAEPTPSDGYPADAMP